MVQEESRRRGMRADALRSRGRLLESAAELIARDGTGVSLEEIAREAGVGSATLHRHFPTRWNLLESIFKDRAEQIAHQADELMTDDPEVAFASWFRALVDMANRTSGLAAVIGPPPEDQASHMPSCHEVIAGAGGRLLHLSKASGDIRADIQIEELMAMAMAISSLPDRDARNRLLEITVNGWGQPSPGR